MLVVQHSQSTFGLPEDQWNSAKAELRAAILAAAQERRMTSYGEIASKVITTHVEAFSPLMNHLLGAIFRDKHDAGSPALTAIVTHKSGDKEPGPGFYDMARGLGIQFSEPYLYWATQVQDVFKLHGQPRRTRLDGAEARDRGAV
jgi:hypothetical protein